MRYSGYANAIWPCLQGVVSCKAGLLKVFRMRSLHVTLAVQWDVKHEKFVSLISQRNISLHFSMNNPLFHNDSIISRWFIVVI